MGGLIKHGFVSPRSLFLGLLPLRGLGVGVVDAHKTGERLQYDHSGRRGEMDE